MLTFVNHDTAIGPRGLPDTLFSSLVGAETVFGRFVVICNVIRPNGDIVIMGNPAPRTLSWVLSLDLFEVPR